MFRNVTLKCLTEIAGVSVNQYEEQFVNLFTLTMCQLKQVHTDTLNHTQLHFYTSANPQITSVCPHKGWICAFLLHRCCLWTLILDWPIPMGRTTSKILSRTSACSSAPSLKSTASSSRRDPTCERRWWRWDTPTLVDHEWSLLFIMLVCVDGTTSHESVWLHVKSFIFRQCLKYIFDYWWMCRYAAEPCYAVGCVQCLMLQDVNGHTHVSLPLGTALHATGVRSGGDGDL